MALSRKIVGVNKPNIHPIKIYKNMSYQNQNKFINQIRAPGGHIQITIMIDTQQQYINLNIRGEISIIVVQAHSGRKRDICT